MYPHKYTSTAEGPNKTGNKKYDEMTEQVFQKTTEFFVKNESMCIQELPALRLVAKAHALDSPLEILNGNQQAERDLRFEYSRRHLHYDRDRLLQLRDSVHRLAFAWQPNIDYKVSALFEARRDEMKALEYAKFYEQLLIDHLLWRFTPNLRETPKDTALHFFQAMQFRYKYGMNIFKMKNSDASQLSNTLQLQDWDTPTTEEQQRFEPWQLHIFEACGIDATKYTIPITQRIIAQTLHMDKATFEKFVATEAERLGELAILCDTIQPSYGDHLPMEERLVDAIHKHGLQRIVALIEYLPQREAFALLNAFGYIPGTKVELFRKMGYSEHTILSDFRRAIKKIILLLEEPHLPIHDDPSEINALIQKREQIKLFTIDQKLIPATSVRYELVDALSRGVLDWKSFEGKFTSEEMRILELALKDNNGELNSVNDMAREVKRTRKRIHYVINKAAGILLQHTPRFLQTNNLEIGVGTIRYQLLLLIESKKRDNEVKSISWRSTLSKTSHTILELLSTVDPETGYYLTTRQIAERSGLDEKTVQKRMSTILKEAAEGREFLENLENLRMSLFALQATPNLLNANEEILVTELLRRLNAGEPLRSESQSGTIAGKEICKLLNLPEHTYRLFYVKYLTSTFKHSR